MNDENGNPKTPYTLLKTDDNRRVVVPNSVMASQTTINLTGNAPRVSLKDGHR